MERIHEARSHKAKILTGRESYAVRIVLCNWMEVSPSSWKGCAISGSKKTEFMMDPIDLEALQS